MAAVIDCGRAVFAAAPLLCGEQAQNSAVENTRPAAPRCGTGPQAVRTDVCRRKNEAQRESGRGSVPLRPAPAGGRGLCSPLKSEAGASPSRRAGGEGAAAYGAAGSTREGGPGAVGPGPGRPLPAALPAACGRRSAGLALQADRGPGRPLRARHQPRASPRPIGLGRQRAAQSGRSLRSPPREAAGRGSSAAPPIRAPGGGDSGGRGRGRERAGGGRRSGAEASGGAARPPP